MQVERLIQSQAMHPSDSKYACKTGNMACHPIGKGFWGMNKPVPSGGRCHARKTPRTMQVPWEVAELIADRCMFSPTTP